MRKIVHIDADCFFAAVETRENPRLATVPLAVGGDPGRRGVIATCNYEARRFGVHSAMPSGVAMRLCPHLTILKPNIGLYKEVSAQMQAIFSDYTDTVEPLSLDEAFLDLTDASACRGSATLVAQEIRARVKSELGITVSAGAAPVKFLAKIASDWRKPDGFFAITPDEVANFVTALPVKSLPGVGKVTETRLNRYGLYDCGDIQAWGLDKLVHHFGSFGDKLHRMAQGQDERPVVPSRIRKSISVERTYAQDISGVGELEGVVRELLCDLDRRFERIRGDYSPSKQFVKLKFDDFRQTTLESPLNSRRGWEDAQHFFRLLQAAWHRYRRPVRLVGLGLRLNDRLSGARQLALFE
jgi:DNA polymerase-4